MKTLAVFLLVLVAPCLSRFIPRNFHKEAFGKAPYIIGGEDADAGEYPFQGFMEIFRQFSCGVTILNEEWVLTAAHCSITFEILPSFVTVGVGYTNRDSDEGTKYDVAEIRCNDDFVFNPATGDDICVMRLEGSLEFSDTVAPATLAEEGDDFSGAENCFIIGWGLSDPSSNQPPVDLQEAAVTVFSLQECEEMYGADQIDDSEHVCVGMLGQSGACSGDSGGPAFCEVDGTMVQIGVASWVATDGLQCDIDFPAVYTDVGFFRSWINENCDNCLGS